MDDIEALHRSIEQPSVPVQSSEFNETRSHPFPPFHRGLSRTMPGQATGMLSGTTKEKPLLFDQASDEKHLDDFGGLSSHTNVVCTDTTY